MADNADNKTAAQASPPESADGAAQSGDDAPVFVSNVGEYFRHVRAVGRAKNADQWIRVARSIRRLGGLLFLGFAVLYALLFTIAGALLPQLYQAWLDLCLPLAEYVGGLTPRAERIMAQLTENGYPERADDALHGIAMAKVLTMPAFICMVAGFLSAASPMFVSCTPRTHTKIWSRVFIGIPGALAVGIGIAYALEFVIAEHFGNEVTGIKKIFNYHRGNYAMMIELFLLFGASLFASSAVAGPSMMRLARFNIVKQPPGDKQ